MKFLRTERFKRCYKKLAPDQQGQIKAAITKMAASLFHPSLRVKNIQGTSDIWEASPSMGLRITFQLRDELIILRNCGEHDKTLKNP